MACYEILEINVELQNTDKDLLKKAVKGLEGAQVYDYGQSANVVKEVGGRVVSVEIDYRTGNVRHAAGNDVLIPLIKQAYAREAVNELAHYGWDIEQTDNGVTLTQGGRGW